MERRMLIKAAVMTVAARIAATVSAESRSTQPDGSLPDAVRDRKARRPFIEADDGTKLFYRDWGDGAPIVFCHPWALNADIWEYQAIELSDQGLRCITFDRRGHGRSDDPGRGYDFDTLAGDLAALIEQLDLRAATLVGYSMGSAEVIRYVARHGGHRIARVLLVSPIAPVPTNRTLNENFVAGLKKDRPAFLAAGLPLFFGRQPSVSPAMSQWVLDQFLRASPKGIIECMRHNATNDQRADLGAMTIPTLIIQGDRDEVSPPELTGRKLAQAIPGSELTIYEGAPHGIVLTHRERFTLDLLSFVRRGHAGSATG